MDTNDAAICAFVCLLWFSKCIAGWIHSTNTLIGIFAPINSRHAIGPRAQHAAQTAAGDVTLGMSILCLILADLAAVLGPFDGAWQSAALIGAFCAIQIVGVRVAISVADATALSCSEKRTSEAPHNVA